MNKKGGRILIILGFIIFIGGILIINEEDYEKDLFDSEYLHWKHMPITYSYRDSCVGPILKEIEWSFDILENETGGLVTFQEVGDSGDISFICYKEQNAQAGRSGAIFETILTQGLATTNYSENIIYSAKIEFFGVSENTKPSDCYTYPKLELHEILHTLGFGHIEDIYSIMTPYDRGCIAKDYVVTKNGKSFIPKDKLDEEIISCLNYIYSNQTIGECISKIKFIDDEDYDCEDGWYKAINDNSWCCPEPKMIINEEGYCDYD